jgi:hypothetical protein
VKHLNNFSAHADLTVASSPWLGIQNGRCGSNTGGMIGLARHWHVLSQGYFSASAAIVTRFNQDFEVGKASTSDDWNGLHIRDSAGAGGCLTATFNSTSGLPFCCSFSSLLNCCPVTQSELVPYRVFCCSAPCLIHSSLVSTQLLSPARGKVQDPRQPAKQLRRQKHSSPRPQ